MVHLVLMIFYFYELLNDIFVNRAFFCTMTDAMSCFRSQRTIFYALKSFQHYLKVDDSFIFIYTTLKSPSWIGLQLICKNKMVAIPVCIFQAALIRAEEERDKNDMEIIKQREKTALLEAQIQKAQSDRENLQSEMEILLDRINKLSELLDKARVGQIDNIL